MDVRTDSNSPSGEAREEIGLDPVLRDADISQDFLETNYERARARQIKHSLAVVRHRFSDHLRIHSPGPSLPIRRNTVQVRERVDSPDPQLLAGVLENVGVNDLRRGSV